MNVAQGVIQGAELVADADLVWQNVGNLGAAKGPRRLNVGRHKLLGQPLRETVDRQKIAQGLILKNGLEGR